MTQTTVDFNGDTVGVAPAGWTERWNTASGSPVWHVETDTTCAGGKRLEFSKSSGSLFHTLTNDALGSSIANCEMLVRFNMSSVSQQGMGICGARLGNGSVAANQDGYIVYYSSAGADAFRIGRISNGTLSVLGNNYQPDVPSEEGPDANQWYYVRFNVNGTALKARFWHEDEHEPLNIWHIETSDSNFSTGYVGFIQLKTPEIRYDFMVVTDDASTADWSGLTTADDILVDEGAYNVVALDPKDNTVRVAEAAYNVVGSGAANIELYEAAYNVVALESTADPQALAWTFTMDGHELYVLQLPDETLVYDTGTESWYQWAKGNSSIWQALYGIDWIANSGNILEGLDDGQNALNVVVGDITNGALYFLHPELDMDDPNDGTTATLQFERQLYGQISHRGRDYLPVAAVEVEASTGQSSADVDDFGVKLEYSDDKGQSFTSAGTITTVPGTYDTRLDWRSLGSMKAPGRLFRLTDYGAIARIDGMDQHEDGS